MDAQSAALRGSERSLKLVVGLMTKTLLQNLGRLQAQPGFAKLWDRMLQVSHYCARSHPTSYAANLQALSLTLFHFSHQEPMSPIAVPRPHAACHGALAKINALIIAARLFSEYR